MMASALQWSIDSRMERLKTRSMSISNGNAALLRGPEQGERIRLPSSFVSDTAGIQTFQTQFQSSTSYQEVDSRSSTPQRDCL